MKKSYRGFLSVLLIVSMLASMLMTSAVFAADESALTTNGAYTDGNWAAGGNGEASYIIGEGDNATNVKLSKTAQPVAGEQDTFDVTLRVETSTNTIVQTNSAAVVLVIDTSSSMERCAECGSTWGHSNTCPYRNNNTFPTRIVSAKEAAKEFLKTYAGTDAAATRMISIVTFDSTGRVNQDWINVAGGSSNPNYTSVINTISALDNHTGKHMEDGLRDAAGQLKKSAVSGITSKSVVLLSDGAPSRSDSGRNASEHCAAAKTQAKAVKDTGAALYTVCFGASRDEAYGNVSVGDFLKKEIATAEGYAYNADNTEQLMSAFKAISESITNGLDGSGWTATDPMNEEVTVTSGAAAGVFASADAKNYTWTLKNAEIKEDNGVTTYVYTYTYRVTVDFTEIEGYVEGSYYPLNEPTVLNVGDKTYAFPVPAAKGTLPRTEVTVNKVWADNNNQDGIRPTSITLQLKKDGEAFGAPVVLENGATTYTWTDLIEKSSGVTHAYTVEELNVKAGYTATYSEDQLTVTNTHIPEKTEVTITKIWDDANNQDGKRPESITVRLLANGNQVGEPITMSKENAADANTWTYIVTGLDKYANQGQPVVYTVTEDAIDPALDYVAAADQLTITNTHIPEVKDVTVTKIWDDANNQDGKRPASVTINLLANDEKVGEVTLTAENAVEGDANQWSYTFEGVAKYANTKEIVYTISENAIEESRAYTAEYSEDKLTVTNKHVPEVVTLTGTKTWDDNNNANGMRPESITIHLKANGEEVKAIQVTAEDEWKYEFKDLPVYKAGNAIQYTITEDAVEDYTPTVDGMDIKNTYTPNVTSVSVTKVWEDADNQDGVRMNSVEIQLLANNEAVEGQTLTLSAGNDWTGTFTNLPVKMNMEEVVYTVEEVTESDFYTVEITGDATEGYTVTNTHIPEEVTISGTKIWEDRDNWDNKRPESITVRLKADGVEVEAIKVTEEDEWSYSFADLPKYKNVDGEGGIEILYTVTEDAIEDYTTTYAEDGYDITNTHTPDKTSVTVSKIWEDENDQDGIRPDSITVILKADEIVTDKEVVLNEENKWTATFEDLYVNNKGEKIVYSVIEEEIDGYKSVVTGDAVKGFTVTNIHEPAMIEVAGTKTWNDGNNQDGKRPEAITVNLIANGEKIASKEVTEVDGWAYKFENLPEFAAGEKIAYAVTENAVEGYTVTVDGYNLTNSYTPELTSVTVTKNWQDTNDKDGIRPDSIIVRLLANGEDTGLTMELTAEYKWVGMFAELPAYENGKKIEYTVEEEAVKDYTTVITGSAEKGFEITNSHTSVPKTGDHSNFDMYIAMVGVCVVGLITMVVMKKKASKN